MLKKFIITDVVVNFWILYSKVLILFEKLFFSVIISLMNLSFLINLERCVLK